MEDLITWALSTQYGPYVVIAISICYALSHVVQYLPTTWTAKIPDWVMYIINSLAAKHGAEASAKTDMSGNTTK